MILIPQKYAYLVGTLVFLIIWILLYKHRKDLRKEMIAMSIFIAIAGVIAEYLWWTADWWRPQTVTNTLVGFEDILLGFTNGGIAAVLYEEIFRRSLYKRKQHVNHLQCFFFVIAIFLIMGTSFWFFRHTSFVATTIALALGGGMLIVLRRDLFWSALINGMLMAIVSLPVYYFLILTSPNFVAKTYLLNNLTRVTITGIPLEDIVFYFLVGFIVAPLYEYWQCMGLRKISLVSKGNVKIKSKKR